MDKGAFFYQLKSSIANNDRKLFAKTIYDLPHEVIIGFTKEELSLINNISRHFSSQKMDRLCNFLEIQGSSFMKKALKGVDELNNCLLGKFYYSIYVFLYERNEEKVKRVLVNHGVAFCKLAEMGIDSRENLENAVRLCHTAQKTLPKKDIDYSIALMTEGNARLRLAEMGIDSRENLEIAVNLYSSSREIFPKESANYALTLMNEGTTRVKLAEMGINSRENLENAVSLYSDSRKTLPKKVVDYSLTLMNEGNARSRLAEMGINSRENLENAVSLYSDSREIFPKKGMDHARALMNEGTTRVKLAEMGINSRENLENAVSLYNESRTALPKKSSSYARMLMNEGNARSRLAEMGINSRENLENAVNLYSDSRKTFTIKSADYACALSNEGSARQILAKIGIESKKNLEIAFSLYGTAREIFPKTSLPYALALMNEGSVKLKLAEIDTNSRENIEDAITLYVNSRGIFPKTSLYYSHALMNEGNARRMLTEMNIERQENFNKSKELYLESISILEGLGDGWTYSIALLNLNSLLKDNFYKTGDKKYLEEWEKNLGDIEEKIKDRDISYKNYLMARVREIRASLLEFEGKSGINKASREYSEAYNLSKDIFYSFMDEFCQARSDNKSFCKLVSDWREKEKENIFLDYYDYAVFECHLENALKNTIIRKKELELAKRKLEEVGNRTQIKIINKRISAYVFLINSLNLCFEQGLYENAAENVLKAYNIFLEFDDKSACEMCEYFNRALLENQNPESWRNIVEKILLSGEFASNFYRLLCSYSDRKRTNILQTLPFQILEKTSIIEAKLDQISVECISIKDQIEKGFDGTVAELRQVKEKVDNIQQNLDNLVLISNDIGGKEGECIREFALQMLEIIKKEDCETLKRFIERVVQNSSSIAEIIEAAEIPEKEKEEAKSKLFNLKKITGILKEKAKSFSVDVTKDVIVSLTAEEIITLLTPILSTATFGVPIPSQIVTMLIAAMKNP